MADWNCDLCKEYQSGHACTFCDDGSKFNKMSNADKIRAMNDLELAKFLERFGTFNQPCGLNVGEPLKWLQSEAE